MTPSTEALQAAAGALQQISERTPGERGRRASVGALVLRAVESHLANVAEANFLQRRAEREIERVGGEAERGILYRVLQLSERGDAGPVASALSDYAAGLEEARRLPEAAAVICLALALDPEDASLALRAGRISRLLGERERALSLYRVARELDGGNGSIARLASIGEAVVSEAPEFALSAAIREAVAAEDNEAAAVGLEERARVRRGRGSRPGAARDLGFAAVRYTDTADRGRVAHQLADLFVAAGDPQAAREALLFAINAGDPMQGEHARARLHTVSRDLGDQVGMRRWRTFKPQTLVSLSSRPATRIAESAAPAFARWRERVEALVVLTT
ncbi:MAG: hypothetical protein GEU90_15750 [Gemmatimonas sp.]|nr:hypothetical protein [Gemmatimonas sp.]